jgi:hypothetical protein
MADVLPGVGLLMCGMSMSVFALAVGCSWLRRDR